MSPAYEGRGFHCVLDPLGTRPVLFLRVPVRFLLLGPCVPTDAEFELSASRRRPAQQFLTAGPRQVLVGGLQVRGRLASHATAAVAASRQRHCFPVDLTLTLTLPLTLEMHLTLMVVHGFVATQGGRGPLRGFLDGLGLGGRCHAVGPPEGAPCPSSSSSSAAAAGEAGDLAVLAADRLQLPGPEVAIFSFKPVGQDVAFALVTEQENRRGEEFRCSVYALC